jgi:hypothetical protein
MSQLHTEDGGRSTEYVARILCLLETAALEEAAGVAFDTGGEAVSDKLTNDFDLTRERGMFTRVGSLETHKSGGSHVV